MDGHTASVDDTSPRGSSLVRLRFAPSSSVIDPASWRAFSAALEPVQQRVGIRVELVAGTGKGASLQDITLANDRLRRLANAVPIHFEVGRRFDPGVPHDSVDVRILEDRG
jgi:hypothetical protein